MMVLKANHKSISSVIDAISFEMNLRYILIYFTFSFVLFQIKLMFEKFEIMGHCLNPVFPHLTILYFIKFFNAELQCKCCYYIIKIGILLLCILMLLSL